MRDHCNNRIYNNELNIEILFVLFELFVEQLPEKAILKIGRIIQESAQMVADKELNPDMREEYISKAVKDYLETSTK